MTARATGREARRFAATPKSKPADRRHRCSPVCPERRRPPRVPTRRAFEPTRQTHSDRRRESLRSPVLPRQVLSKRASPCSPKKTLRIHLPCQFRPGFSLFGRGPPPVRRNSSADKKNRPPRGSERRRPMIIAPYPAATSDFSAARFATGPAAAVRGSGMGRLLGPSRLGWASGIRAANSPKNAGVADTCKPGLHSI